MAAKRQAGESGDFVVDLAPKKHKTCAHDLMRRFRLEEKDCNQEIEDAHGESIFSKLCGQWKFLITVLELPKVWKDDLQQDCRNEADRRVNFFSKWKKKDGSSVTYIRLIRALLDINNKEDAEEVCKFLKDLLSRVSTASGKSIILRCCQSVYRRASLFHRMNRQVPRFYALLQLIEP